MEHIFEKNITFNTNLIPMTYVTLQDLRF